MCAKCYKVVKRQYVGRSAPLNEHECIDSQTYRCPHCKEDFPVPVTEKKKPHYCHIQRPNPKKVETPDKFSIIAFDYETISKRITNEKQPCYGKKRQHPFLASAVIFCEKCFRNKGKWKENCETEGCGKKRKTWYNRPLKFARWLMFDPERRPGVKTVALSHNGK